MIDGLIIVKFCASSSGMGTQGHSPVGNHWRDFQDWYHTVSKDPSYHPYVPKASKITRKHIYVNLQYVQLLNSEYSQQNMFEKIMILYFRLVQKIWTTEQTGMDNFAIL